MTYDDDVRQGLEDRVGYNGLDAIDSVLEPLTLKSEDGRFVKVEPFVWRSEGPEALTLYRIVEES
jgi:hypothetical protein